MSKWEVLRTHEPWGRLQYRTVHRSTPTKYICRLEWNIDGDGIWSVPPLADVYEVQAGFDGFVRVWLDQRRNIPLTPQVARKLAEDIQAAALTAPRLNESRRRRRGEALV